MQTENRYHWEADDNEVPPPRLSWHAEILATAFILCYLAILKIRGKIRAISRSLRFAARSDRQ